jgi:hypothetical protein
MLSTAYLPPLKVSHNAGQNEKRKRERKKIGQLVASRGSGLTWIGQTNRTELDLGGYRMAAANLCWLARPAH